MTTRRQTDLSMIALIAANMVPVLGVLLFGWDIRHTLVLYWAENVVIGFYSVLRMALAQGQQAKKVLLIPFFMFHFGMFTAVHGVFVFALSYNFLDKAGYQPLPVGVFMTILSGFAALFVSHGISFVRNYVLGGEMFRTTVEQAMSRPYSRVLVMHFTILAGGFLSSFILGTAVGSTAIGTLALPLVLIVIKTAIDLNSHRLAHSMGNGAREAGNRVGSSKEESNT